MRSISLLPGATDAVVALGAGAQLAGVSHSCDGAPAGVPVVTRCAIVANGPSASIDSEVREITESGSALYSLDEALLTRLAPDLIITQGLCEVCAVSEAAVHRLAAALPSQPRVLSISGGSVDGILADIAAIGDAIDAHDEADELVSGIRVRIRRVHETLKAARAPRPRVAVLEWTDPLFCAGHWVPEQVKRAGGVDVLGTAGAVSRVINSGELERADPHMVIVAPCGFDLDRAELEARRLRETIPFLATKELWALDANALTSRPGPRVVDGIEVLTRLFAPAVFTTLGPTQARRIR